MAVARGSFGGSSSGYGVQTTASRAVVASAPHRPDPDPDDLFLPRLLSS